MGETCLPGRTGSAAAIPTGTVYRRILASRIRGQLAYPASFALDVLAQVLGQGVELVTILVVFTQVRSLGGFRAGEVVLLYGLASVAFGLASLAVAQVDELPEFIRSGEFDVLLLRPLGSLAQLLSADISLKRIGRVVTGLVVLGVAVAGSDIDWDLGRAVLLVTTPLVGAVILGSVWIGASAVAFWLVDAREVANAFTYGSNYSTSYPITIYGPWLRRLICFLIPSAFVAYFPALALLGKPDPLGLPAGLRWSSPAVAVLTVAAAALVWRAGVRHYQGTGS
ncbi:MAG: ABC transporter permease [Pseudonocardia sp.]